MQQKSSNATGQMFLTSATSETSGTSDATSSQGDFLASHTVSPGSEQARQMTARSGRKCAELLRNPNPAGCLVKMFLESSIWNSTECFLTWKALATPRGRWCFQLAPWTQDTDETVFGLWPTPTAAEAAHSGRNVAKPGSQYHLVVAVKDRMWPTPRAANPGSRPNGKGGRVLEEEVQISEGMRTRGSKLLPTPRAADGTKGIRTPEGGAKEKLPRKNGQDLPTTVGGRLNPNWVEGLMGYPIGPTDLKDSATPSSRKSQP